MSGFYWPDGTRTMPRVSSGFGPRNLANPLASKYHRGTDFYGFTVVHSVADGEVVFAGWNSEVGWSTVAGFMIWVQHDGFFSRYLHNAPGTQRVRAGARVAGGQPLIGLGWSGLANPSDAHSHVEITPGKWHRGNVDQVDPVAFLSARVGKTTGSPSLTPGATAPLTASEEDDMAHPIKFGPHLFLMGPGFISHLVNESAANLSRNIVAADDKWIELNEGQFKLQLDNFGIPRNVVDFKNGFVLDPGRTDKARVKGGVWSWARASFHQSGGRTP